MYATLTKGTMIAEVTGTGLLVSTDTRDGWTTTIEHDGDSAAAVADLLADGYTPKESA